MQPDDVIQHPRMSLKNLYLPRFKKELFKTIA